MTELRPMSEAPRDGSEFLALYINNIGSACWFIVYFWKPSGSKGKFISTDGKFISTDKHFSRDPFNNNELVGWVPLPEIPEYSK